MRFRLWLLLSVAAAGISWFYVQRILDPWSVHMDSKKGALTAQLGDLYPRWLGTRELLLRRLNPYGSEVNEKIQVAYYGHVLTQNLEVGHTAIDEQRFAYPIYVVLLMAPTARWDFDTVHRWAPLALALLVGLAVLLCVDCLHWRLPWEGLAALVLFTLSTPEIIQGLRLRQLGLLVGFLVALAAWCVTRNHLASAGVILALATIKPQMVIVPLLWFLIWTLGMWRERWRLVAGLFGGVAALIGLGEWLLPGWLPYFFFGLQAYTRYVPMKSLLGMILGDWLSYAISGIAIIGLLWCSWRKRRYPASSIEFTYTLGMFLLAETIVLPLLPPFNQVLLLLPAVIVVRNWKSQPRGLRTVFAVAVGWPWVVSFGLLMIGAHAQAVDRTFLWPAALAVLMPFLIVFLSANEWRQMGWSGIQEAGAE